MQRVLVAACLLTLGLSRTPATAAELPRDFVRLYAPAVEKLRAAYTHASVWGTVKHELPAAGKSVEQRFVFRVSGSRVRMDVTTLVDRGTGARVGATNLYMATRDGSLVTFRNPGQEVFNDATELKYGDTKSHIEGTCLLNTAYTFGGHPTLLDFLKQDNVKRVKVVKIKLKGEPLVKVSYEEVIHHDDSPQAWNSYFLLSPDRGWAIRKYSRTTGEGRDQIIYQGSLMYSGSKEGVPLAETIESVQERGADHTVVVRDSVIVNKFILGEPNNEFFTAFDF